MEWVPILVIAGAVLIGLVVLAGWFGNALIEAIEAFVEEDERGAR